MIGVANDSISGAREAVQLLRRDHFPGQAAIANAARHRAGEGRVAELALDDRAPWNRLPSPSTRGLIFARKAPGSLLVYALDGRDGNNHP